MDRGESQEAEGECVDTTESIIWAPAMGPWPLWPILTVIYFQSNTWAKNWGTASEESKPEGSDHELRVVKLERLHGRVDDIMMTVTICTSKIKT